MQANFTNNASVSCGQSRQPTITWLFPTSFSVLSARQHLASTWQLEMGGRGRAVGRILTPTAAYLEPWQG